MPPKSDSEKCRIMFFFDTEDFTSEKSCDAAMELAKLLRSEGVTGHFAVVGLFAERLVKNGRSDVIESLSRHFVGSHSYSHSIHPDLCERTDTRDFSEAYRAIFGEEEQAVRLLEKTFGQKVKFAVPPGNCKSYAAMYVYRDLGLPFYCDTVVHDRRQSPLSFCGCEHIAYTHAFESVFGANESIPDLLDSLAQKKQAILYCHTNMLPYAQFWDMLNYNGSNDCVFGDWKLPPERPKSETAAFYEKIRQTVRAIKADERFEITTLGEIEQSRPKRLSELTKDGLLEFRRSLNASFAPGTLSLSEIFAAASNYLKTGRGIIPEKTYGLLETPYQNENPVRLDARDIVYAAKTGNFDGFLPPSVDIGEKRLGCAEFLTAMLDAIACDGEGELTVAPKSGIIGCSEYPELETFKLPGTWVHSASLRDDYLSDRLRLQLWTLRHIV